MNKKILIAVIAVIIVVVCAVVGYFIIQGQQKAGLCMHALSVGNYIEYEYNFTGTYVGEMEGTVRAEVIKADGANYTVRADYSPTDGSYAWTETFSFLLCEDFMCPLTMMGQAEYKSDGNGNMLIGFVLYSRYEIDVGRADGVYESVLVHRHSKILICRFIHSPEPTGYDSWVHYVPQIVIEITDSDIEWLTVD